MNDQQDFYIVMKSHSESPDYEDYCQANSKIQAAKKFAKRLNSLNALNDSDDYWDAKELYRYIASEEEMNATV